MASTFKNASITEWPQPSLLLQIEADFLAPATENAKFSGVQHRRVAEGSPFFKMFKR
jgi:hypothetical protein